MRSHLILCRLLRRVVGLASPIPPAALQGPCRGYQRHEVEKERVWTEASSDVVGADEQSKGGPHHLRRSEELMRVSVVQDDEGAWGKG